MRPENILAPPPFTMRKGVPMRQPKFSHAAEAFQKSLSSRKFLPRELPTGNKICSACEMDKDVTDFRVHPSTIDRRRGVCIECESATNKAKYQAAKLKKLKKHR